MCETKWLGEVPVLDAVAVLTPDGGVSLFAVNRSQMSPLFVDVDLRAWPGYRVASHRTLADDDPDTANTAADPDRVVPRSLPVPADGGELVLPPLSWNLVPLDRSGVDLVTG